MNDIPLTDANILWTPTNAQPARPGLAGTVTVEHRQESHATTLYAAHRRKMGSCIMWHKWSEAERLVELFRYVQTMTINDGISPAAVHTALSAIPEYRRAMCTWFDEWYDEFAVAN